VAGVAIGVALLVVALVIRQGPPSGLYMAFMTPAVALASSTSIANVDKTDAQPPASTLIAAGLVLLASAIAVIWARYQATTSTSAKASAAVLASRAWRNKVP